MFNSFVPFFALEIQFQNLLDDVCQCAEKFLEEASKYGEVRNRQFRLYQFRVVIDQYVPFPRVENPSSSCSGWCSEISPWFSLVFSKRRSRFWIRYSRHMNCFGWITVMCSQIWRHNDMGFLSIAVDLLKGFGCYSSQLNLGMDKFYSCLIHMVPKQRNLRRDRRILRRPKGLHILQTDSSCMWSWFWMVCNPLCFCLGWISYNVLPLFYFIHH